MRRGRVAVIVTALTLAAQSRAGAVDQKAYLDLIAQAQRGNVRQAVAAAVRWSREDVKATLAGFAPCTDRCAMAAVLLHTEAGAVQMDLNKTDIMKAHFDAAEVYLNAERSRRKHVGQNGVFDFEALHRLDDFERRWLLARGYLCQQFRWVDRATSLYDKVLSTHPTDPEALLARGALDEQRAAMRGPSPDRRIEALLEDAARRYKSALAARPDLPVAHLRLGWVLRLGGRMEDGKRELLGVLAKDPPPEIAAYVRLFLGDIAEREGRADEAIGLYSAALAADPRLQPAKLALARLLRGMGRRAEAGKIIEALRSTRDDEVHTWYDYHTTTFRSCERALDGLWAEVQE